MREDMVFLLRRGLWYLAHPYAHPDHVVNVDLCVNRAAQLAALGITCVPPIIYTHPVHELLKTTSRDMERDNPDFWYEYDEKIMEHCDGIILAGDWKASRGCQQERWWFKGAHRPVFTMEEVIEIMRLDSNRGKTGCNDSGVV